MNDKVQRHGEICREINELYAKKNHDYGDSFGQTFKEEGFAMSRIRLSDKLNRFKTLSRKGGGTARQRRVYQGHADRPCQLRHYDCVGNGGRRG